MYRAAQGRFVYASGFYTYCYLASESFLLGYSFPALPVRAYIAHGGRDVEHRIVSALRNRTAERERRVHQHAQLSKRTDTRSKLKQRSLKKLHDSDHRLPDATQQSPRNMYCVPDFFLEPDICVFCDGGVQDEAQQRRGPMAASRAQREIGAHNEYRTKHLVLEVWDRQEG